MGTENLGYTEIILVQVLMKLSWRMCYRARGQVD
jgi:hypothetical protein